ncbi:MAG: ADP-heptosyltransferase [Chitinophagales bacterium]|nr:MAG: ADP-heptosyltransferase [Chitinophagales bacterium]
MRILIIQTAFAGDVILATVLIEKLYAAYPQAEIDFLLRKGNENLLENNPKVSHVLIWNKQSGKYRNLLALIPKIRRREYDLVVNVQRFFSTGLLTVLSAAKETTGFAKNPLSLLFSRRVPHTIIPEKRIHETERNLSLISHLTDIGPVKPVLYPAEKDFQRVKPKSKYICIAPASIWFTKQWPAHKWIELIQRLDPSYSIYLLGGKDDFHTCRMIQEKSGRHNVINLAGALTFLESAALMKNAEMNYVHDSAPMHLASAVNAPVTVIYCSTIPGFGFTPLSDFSVIIEYPNKLDCRPCGLHGLKACPRGHFQCSHIEVSQVIALSLKRKQPMQQVP